MTGPYKKKREPHLRDVPDWMIQHMQELGVLDKHGRSTHEMIWRDGKPVRYVRRRSWFARFWQWFTGGRSVGESIERALRGAEEYDRLETYRRIAGTDPRDR